MENIEKNVFAFFKQHLRNVKHFDKKTIINSPDLLVDDGGIILEEFVELFNVENCSLDLDKYFNPLKNPFITLIDYFKNRKRVQKRPIITIGHMIEVAEKGEWFDPG